MRVTVLAGVLAAAAGFATFEDAPAKMTYAAGQTTDCEHRTPPEGPRGEDGTGYGFLAAYPLWDAKCFNENCARETGNRDGGKTGGWTKNTKQCNTVESETVLDHGWIFGIASGRICKDSGSLWSLQEKCFEWCAQEATRLGYGSTNHPNPQYCCALKFGGNSFSKSDGDSYNYRCQLSRDGAHGFQSPKALEAELAEAVSEHPQDRMQWTAIKVFSTSCSAEYADPAACASD